MTQLNKVADFSSVENSFNTLNLGNIADTLNAIDAGIKSNVLECDENGLTLRQATSDTAKAATMLNTTANALIVGKSTDIALSDFIKIADSQAQFDFVNSLVKRAKLLNIHELVIGTLLDRYMISVKKERAKLGKDFTLLPCDSATHFMARKKGTLTFERKTWVENSWVVKAQTAAKLKRLLELDGEKVEVLLTDNDNNTGENDNLTKAIDAAKILEFNDLQLLLESVQMLLELKG